MIISDSFKGTLSSQEICSIGRDCLCRLMPSCERLSIPGAADGFGASEIALLHVDLKSEVVVYFSDRNLTAKSQENQNNRDNFRKY